MQQVNQVQNISSQKLGGCAFEHGRPPGHFDLLSTHVYLVLLGQVEGSDAGHYFGQWGNLTHGVAFERVYPFIVADHTDVLGWETAKFALRPWVWLNYLWLEKVLSLEFLLSSANWPFSMVIKLNIVVKCMD